MTFRLATRALPPGGLALRGIPPTMGGVALFLGRVRPDRVRGRTVVALQYEAYAPLARREMARLEKEARSRFGVLWVRAVHRVGRVEVGEVAVAILVAAPHRSAALRAARFLIDRLKRDVPIWKQDVLRGAPSSVSRATVRGRIK